MSEKAFDGATVVVTGAARGIGAAIAVAFADAGANVCLNDVVDGDDFDETVERCRSRGAAARKVIADVSDAGAVDRLVATAVEAFGRLDVAVPNAAFSVREPFHTADLDAFRRTVDVTMWGTFHVVRSAVNQFLRQGGGGAVVAVSSTHAYRPVPNAMAYNMSKAAIEQVCRTAATELVAERIRVNCVRPGWVDTPGERTHHSDEKIAELSPLLPWGRMARAEEVARAVMFMADPRNDYINGTELLVDGGAKLPVDGGLGAVKKSPPDSV